MKIVYIAGHGRNGGTLVDRVLGQYRGFVSLGEFKFVWLKGLLNNELCNCGAAFRDCPFWTDVMKEAFGAAGPPDPREVIDLYRRVDRSRHIPLLALGRAPASYRRRTVRYRDILERLHLAVATVSNARVMINSSKFSGYGMVLASIPSVELFVLHLVRDSRAAAFSWSKQIRKPEDAAGNSYMRRYNPARSALQWFHRNASAELLASPAQAYRLLRYEDFATRPAAVAGSLLSWLGEEDLGSPFVDDSCVELDAGHTQSGNPSRFRTGKIDIRLDDEWRQRMPFRDGAAVTALTWPLLLRYGYPLTF